MLSHFLTLQQKYCVRFPARGGKRWERATSAEKYAAFSQSHALPPCLFLLHFPPDTEYEKTLGWWLQPKRRRWIAIASCMQPAEIDCDHAAAFGKIDSNCGSWPDKAVSNCNFLAQESKFGVQFWFYSHEFVESRTGNDLSLLFTLFKHTTYSLLCLQSPTRSYARLADIKNYHTYTNTENS